MFKTKSFAIPIVCLILGLMISWQYKSIYSNKKLDVSYINRLEDLKDELINEKNNNENLRKRNEEIVKQLKDIEGTNGNAGAYEKNLKTELERARILACLTDVSGKGIVVTISSAPGSQPISEQDILSLVNELRACDAQAISVNDERMTAMSEVRNAGNYIVVNGKQMLPPFTVKAIGDQDKMNNSIKMTGGVIDALQTFYKLKVNIENKDKLTIPKVRDDGSILKYDLLISQ